METINLFSDTQTLPTEEMYEAMRKAPLGDDMMGMDPTVNKLEAMAARICGKEAALFVASGTMGNLCGLMSLAGAGDEVLLDPESHVWFYEAGAFCSLAGITPRPVFSREGLMSPEDLKAAIRPRNLHMPIPRVLSLENTHNRGEGRVVPIELHRALCQVARDHDLSIHLDGARIFNAQMASGIPVSEYASTVDSLTFCLSKGLSCPVGSLLVGSREHIEKARRVRKRLGGAMRQAGVLAAAGIVALTTMVARLVEDHANAKLLAYGLNCLPGLKLNLKRVETNMVYVNCAGTGKSAAELAGLFKGAGVLVSFTGPHVLRFVTHRLVSSPMIMEALQRISPLLQSL
jgi:threonine aldolase